MRFARVRGDMPRWTTRETAGLIRLVLITIVGLLITRTFVAGYWHGWLPGWFFLMSLVALVPAWVVNILMWRGYVRLRRGRTREGNPPPPEEPSP